MDQHSVSSAHILTTINELAEKYDTFLLDCDGVIWSGSRPID